MFKACCDCAVGAANAPHRYHARFILRSRASRSQLSYSSFSMSLVRKTGMLQRNMHGISRHIPNATALEELYQLMSTQVVQEVGEVLEGVRAGPLEALVGELYDAARLGRRVCCYGVGREGLCMQGLCMRLYHMGLQANMVGSMACPPVGPGDLLLLSAGPGFFRTVDALATAAREAGARVIVFTAQEDSFLPFADFTVQVPASTMAVHGTEAEGNGEGKQKGVLPMGSSYEAGLWLMFDIIALILQKELGLSDADMSARHTNLE